MKQGFALLELLVGVALLGLGTASLLRLHLDLRRGTDLARQRSEAVRHAANELERLRWLAPVEITATGPAPVAPVAADPSPTRYTLERRVQHDADTRLRSVEVSVRWDDRHAAPHAVTLATALTSLDPAWGAATLLPRGPTTVSPAGPAALPWPERSLRIPAAARDLGDGRHAFKPRDDAALVWLFDSVSGDVIGRCDATPTTPAERLDANSLGDCRALSGLLLAGHIRFSTDRDQLTGADAEQPASPALATALRLGLSTTGHPSPAWECVHDGPTMTTAAPAGRTSIAYHCVVQPATPASGGPPRWSGRLDLVPLGWQLVTASSGNAGRLRVCRYSADHDGNGRIDNPEHPATYTTVTTPLGHQNFLVIRAAARCPVDAGPFGPWSGSNPVDDSTVAHQP